MRPSRLNVACTTETRCPPNVTREWPAVTTRVPSGLNSTLQTAPGSPFEDRAPKTARASWARLPIRDRTILARWSGDAWRTDGNYELLSEDAPVENPAGR